MEGPHMTEPADPKGGIAACLRLILRHVAAAQQLTQSDFELVNGPA